MIGILLIDKPLGCSSHEVVHQLRRKFGTKRVGHAGTLDPLATGLLVVAVGPATRFLQYLPLEPKLYRGEITFGVETNTYDAEGEIVAQKDVPADLAGKIQEALDRFTGLIEQVPPMFSAIKKAGRPLYEYARRGETIERQPRTVHIGRFEAENINGSIATVWVECSGGTYVRSLAHDLGQTIGCGAHLSSLVRHKIGRFDLVDAVHLDQVSPADIIPLQEALKPMQMLTLSDNEVAEIREGRQINTNTTAGGSSPVGMLDVGGTVIGIARPTDSGALQPECVIPTEASYDSP
ncbi:MAG: tRNA pseudouridine(55) synthase TruB [Fimbriimonadaceae bacterium]